MVYQGAVSRVYQVEQAGRIVAGSRVEGIRRRHGAPTPAREPPSMLRIEPEFASLMGRAAIQGRSCLIFLKSRSARIS
jgi:hypothetical protein